jgi:archaellum component FlaC
MKTQEEIEQLAKKQKGCSKEYCDSIDEQYGYLNGYIEGYTQCQEDIEQEINRLKKIMIESSNQAMTWEEKYWQLKNSLNKQS